MGVKIIILTGFLGSGKTTFLKKLLEKYSHKKIGVIMNDFGKIGVDVELIDRGGIKMAEINSGSIFCSCKSDQFIKAMMEVIKEDVETILVESSGLANPSTLPKILDIIKDKKGKDIEKIEILGVMDATNIYKLVQTVQILKQQIAISDLLILNKCDIATDKEKEKSLNAIRQYNDKVLIYETSFAEIPDSIIEGVLHKNDSQIFENQFTIAHNVLVRLPEDAEKEKVEKWVESFKRKIYRIKGFLKLKEGWFYLDGVGEDIKFLPRKENKESFVVILSPLENPLKETLVEEWCKLSDTKIVVE
jgi:G3E family GTPase